MLRKVVRAITKWDKNEKSNITIAIFERKKNLAF